MSAAESIDPLSGLWDTLAVTLRLLRKNAGMSQAEVGRIVRADHKTISNWEARRNAPPIEAMRELDKTWGTGGILESLHYHASHLAAPLEFLAAVEYEAAATVIRLSGVAFIPGLFQTPEYARAVFEQAGEPDVKGQVAVRTQRQSILARENPPYISALISEIALLLTPLPLKRAQFARLLEVASLPHVTLRLLPADAGLQSGLGGDFYIYSTPTREVGYVETPARGSLIAETGDLRKLVVAHDRTAGAALSPDATRAHLKSLIDTEG
ncbi:helix-turn-helix domain-containing protein [Actinomadura atramentaria]|uniref:helix-turn-helix domain-containing protein n=1 Tax=Actinomadura atramentaria TaxID=1990 RepID=UPI000364AEF0|nr:helix-turn-helix transcriptional regulator [Actinomadura atramentaria]